MASWKSQSTIKMDKGYYLVVNKVMMNILSSQSTIKMDKGYYLHTKHWGWLMVESQSTIKMDKGYYNRLGYVYKKKA